MDFYFDNLGTITIAFGILSAMGQAIYHAVKRTGIDFRTFIEKSLAGAGLPIGLAFVLCALDFSRLQAIKNVEGYFLVSGIAIIYLSAIAIWPEMEKGYKKSQRD